MGSYGGFTSGNELLGYCKSEEGTIACAAYLMGVVDTHADISSQGIMGGYFFIPPSVTVRQISQVAVKYMEESPKTLHHSASSLILNALAEAFPFED